MGWQAKVYAVQETGHLPDDLWQKLVTRDTGRCLSCYRKRHLGAHHLIPRGEGGLDLLSNLVVLCGRCHDAIEELQLAYGQIRGYWKHRDRKCKTTKAKPAGKDWYSWVYGGCRDPLS